MRISDWRSDGCSSDLELSKGLEFDLVVLVDPASFGEGIEGAVDRYVAMTRATQRLVVLSRVAESVTQDRAHLDLPVAGLRSLGRSEERRVGKVCVSTCSSRESPSHYKTTILL